MTGTVTAINMRVVTKPKSMPPHGIGAGHQHRIGLPVAIGEHAGEEEFVPGEGEADQRGGDQRRFRPAAARYAKKVVNSLAPSTRAASRSSFGKSAK